MSSPPSAEGAAPVALRGLRGMIAGRMHESLASTAQLSFFADADASALLAARSAWRAAGTAVGYEDLVVAALARAVAGHPLVNATEADGVVTPSPAVHVAVAVALPGALVAPVIRDCHTLDAAAIFRLRRDLAERARAGRLKVAEMTGGTIAVSNLGHTRVAHFTPILLRPQVAIVGLGRIEERAMVRAGAVVVRPMMALSLTVDHRILDGDPAARFLSALAEALETLSPNVRKANR